MSESVDVTFGITPFVPTEEYETVAGTVNPLPPFGTTRAKFVKSATLFIGCAQIVPTQTFVTVCVGFASDPVTWNFNSEIVEAPEDEIKLNDTCDAFVVPPTTYCDAVEPDVTLVGVAIVPTPNETNCPVLAEPAFETLLDTPIEATVSFVFTALINVLEPTFA